MPRFRGLQVSVAYPGTLGVVTDKGVQDVKPNVLDAPSESYEIMLLRWQTGVYELDAPTPVSTGGLIQGYPVVVSLNGGVEVTQVNWPGVPNPNSVVGAVSTVTSNGNGTAITLVDSGGIPMKLFNEDGSAYAGKWIFDIYTSGDGSDANDGSRLLPKATVGSAVETANNGDSIGLRMGDNFFYGDGGDLTKNLVLGTYGGGGSTISGAVNFVGSFSAFTDAYGPEYLTNGNFEAWASTYPDGWSATLTTGTISKDIDTFGNNAVRFANNTSGTNSIRRNTTTFFRPGPTYTFSADIVATVGQIAGFRISNLSGTHYLDEDGIWYEGLRNHNTAPYVSGVLHHSVDFTIPEEIGETQITIIIIQNQTAGKFIVYDNVSFNGPMVEAQSNTWRAVSSSEVYAVRLDGEVSRRGVTQFDLLDQEWFWSGGFLYIRQNSGSPQGLVEVPGKTYIFRSLDYKFTSSDIGYEGFSGPGIILGNTTGTSGDADGSKVIGGRFENIARKDNPGVIRLNRIKSPVISNVEFQRIGTEGIFGFEASYWEVSDCTLNGADGTLTDAFQMSYADEGSAVNAVPSYGNFLRNKVDMRGARNGKGCTMFIRGSHDTMDDCTLLGSGWGFALNADYTEARNNLCAYQEGPFRASGLRISYPRSYVGHSLSNWIVCSSYYGVNIQLGTEAGIIPTGAEAVNNLLIANWNIAGNSIEGFSALPDMPVSGIIRDTIFYNPAASGPDLRVTVGPGGFTLSHCSFGPSRTGQFVVNGVSYNTLSALVSAGVSGLTVTDCIVANPAFADMAAMDFTLVSGSSCIGVASDGGNIGARGQILTRAYTDAWLSARMALSSGWDIAE